MNHYPKWTEFELSLLSDMAAQRFNSFEIAKALIRRSPSAVRLRASKLGISLAQPYFGEIPRPLDTALWSEADRISEWARVPQSLAELLVERANEKDIDLKKVRSATRLQEFVVFRMKFAREAFAKGYSFSSIGRCLNRDHTTIIHAVGFKKRPAYPQDSQNFGDNSRSFRPHHDKIAA